MSHSTVLILFRKTQEIFSVELQYTNITSAFIL